MGDTDGDGTNQDQNPAATPTNSDGDGVDDVGPDDFNFGLNDTGANADHSDNSGNYDIFWNVAVDEPITNVKTIRVIVRWEERGRQKQAVVDFMKNDIIL